MTLDEMKYADTLDSRDVAERIEELRDAIDAYDANPEPDYAEDYAEAVAELATLEAFADEASGYAPDWDYGETLVRDSYFTEYAQELAEDCGMVPETLEWPCYHIDWEAAARDLRMDYSAVELDGVTFWVR